MPQDQLSNDLASLKIDRSSEARPRRGVPGWLVWVVILCGLAALGYFVIYPRVAGSFFTQSVETGEITKVSPAQGTVNLTATGYVVAETSAKVAAKVSGRVAEIMIVEGTNEVIVGKAISGRFKGLGLGEEFELRRNRPLKVVGVFSAAGTSYESEVWGDLDVVRTALGRGSVVSSARVRLESPAKFKAYKAAIEGEKRLGMKVMRERDYYETQSAQTGGFLAGMGIAVAILFSLGAMIGAAITMNGAIAHRTREIGTLRALGFSKLSILASFLLEAIFLALLGGVIGVAFALLLSLASFPVMNFATFSEIVIGFRATPAVLIKALVFSGFMGLLGGLVPAIRAARVSPVEAMRG